MIIYRNALLIGQDGLKDIFVENQKIVKVCKAGESFGIDLMGKVVVPCFVNAFLNPREDQNLTSKKLIDAGIKKTFVNADFDGEMFEKVHYHEGDEESEFDEFMQQSIKNIYIPFGRDLNQLGELSKKYPSPLNFLEEFGVFDKNFSLIGCENLDKEDFLEISNYGGKVVLTPIESLKRCDGFPLFLAMLKQGIVRGIGTGSEEIDLLKAGYVLKNITCLNLCNSEAVTYKEIFELLTDCEIKKGESADFFTIELEKNTYEHLFEKTKNDICQVVLGGKIIKGDN